MCQVHLREQRCANGLMGLGAATGCEGTWRRYAFAIGGDENGVEKVYVSEAAGDVGRERSGITCARCLRD